MSDHDHRPLRWSSVLISLLCPVIGIAALVAVSGLEEYMEARTAQNSLKFAWNLCQLLAVTGGIIALSALLRSRKRSALRLLIGCLSAIVNWGLFLQIIAASPPGESLHRYRISRVEADQRATAVALEEFHGVHGHYPHWTMGEHAANAFLGTASPLWSMPTFQMSVSPGDRMELLTLTTPFAYVDRLPVDLALAGWAGSGTFGYYSNPSGWILFSPGLDKDFDLRFVDFPSTGPLLMHDLVLRAYDPTNGSYSSGDVFRVH
ncbi:hypothetical protein HQ520_09205 [bacterium]|nr:hypothetical protein [bacterium]